jgi:hypothetical protein
MEVTAHTVEPGEAMVRISARYETPELAKDEGRKGTAGLVERREEGRETLTYHLMQQVL